MELHELRRRNAAKEALLQKLEQQRLEIRQQNQEFVMFYKYRNGGQYISGRIR